MQQLCVYCGSNRGARPEYAAAANRLGRLLGERGISLVYGGGNVGLMGVLADAALAAGGAVTGVIPQTLVDREVAHQGLTEQRIVGSMHERKALMAELGDAFIALPGGLGTLDELFEIWTWSQLGFHAKPCGLLDVAGYYQPLVAFLDRAVAEGFVRRPHRETLCVEEDPERLLAMLDARVAPRAGRPLDHASL